MPLDQARWQIDILAADKTAQAFASVDRRMKSLQTQQAQLGQSTKLGAAMAAGGMNALGGAIARLSPLLGPVAIAWATWTAGMKAGAMIDAAAQLGITTEAMQAFHLVALQSGVSTEQFDGALQRLTGAMGAAKDGSDEAIERFSKLGVKLLDSNGQLRPIADVLPEVARGLMQVSSDTERNALAQDLFGRSGSRVVTMLGALAQGTDFLTESARRQSALVDRDVSEAWNKLEAQLKITKVTADAALASLGAPIATVALEAVNKILTDILANLDRLKREAATAPQATAQRAAVNDVKQLEDQLGAARQRQAQFREGSSGFKLEQGSIDGLLRRLDGARQAEQIARQATMEAEEGAARALKLPVVGPENTPTTGKGQPTGKAAGKAGEKLDERLRELRTERTALEKAMAAFDASSGESVTAIDRRLDAQVKLDKKIFDVLKDVPANSPLAAQLTQEATAISRLNQQLEDRKRLLTIAEGAREFIAAQQLEAQTLGMSAEAAARLRHEHELLNQAKAAGIPLTAQQREELKRLAAQMASAEESTRQLKEIHETGREAFRGFFQEVNQGLREGRDVWQTFGDAAVNALNKISDKLLDMAAQELFDNAFGGKGGVSGGGGGLFSSLISGIGSLFSGGVVARTGAGG